jgi:inorganic triphosphatase YgiF
MKEIEAKFPLSASQYEEMKSFLVKLSSYKKFGLVKGDEFSYDSNYYDTITRALTNGRTDLRLRKGSDFTLSFRDVLDVKNDIVLRDRISVVVDSEPDVNLSDLEPVLKAREIVGSDNIRVIVRMRTNRLTLYFKLDNFLAEARLDSVVVTEPSAEGFHEFELELKKGEFETFKVLVEQLVRDFGINVSSKSKFERAVES